MLDAGDWMLVPGRWWLGLALQASFASRDDRLVKPAGQTARRRLQFADFFEILADKVGKVCSEALGVLQFAQ